MISDPKWVEKTPLLTTLLLEGANVGQLHRMWTERTAEGQSLFAWLMVCAALILWANFFRVCAPDQKWARWASIFGVAMNLSVCLTVTYFRYLR
jgi:hypothetical protein